MKCPHCKTAMHPQSKTTRLGQDPVGVWEITQHSCPHCKLFSFILVQTIHHRSVAPMVGGPPTVKEYLVWPKGISRDPVPLEVPADISSDYKESCLVLADSPKASAALSRRCLQHLIENYAKIKKPNLEKEIQSFVPTLPSFIGEQVDAVRRIGNFAAHPIKSKNSGAITDVEPGEAEWNLEVLESLFDHMFVKPALAKKKKADLNQKLKAAGKPEMK